MIIKIGKFNFVSEEEEEFSLSQNEIDSKFNYFYMDGKEDTLYVNSRSNFEDKDVEYYKFEQELLKKYYILEYSSLIHNIIQKFIKDKTFEIFMNNNYAGYDLYKNISISQIEHLKDSSKYNFSYSRNSRKINFVTNKIIYELNSGNSIIFDPYNEEICNLEELYKKGVFDKEIKAGLILKEVQHKKVPKFFMKLVEIDTFLKDKKNVNLIFNDGKKIKKSAELNEIFDIYQYNNEINLCSDGIVDYKLKDLKSIAFNRSEVTIDSKDFINIEKQILRTTEDFILHKAEQLKEELKNNFYKYRKEIEYYMPDTIEECIKIITTLEKSNCKIEQEKYPDWYSKEFTNLWQDYERIKILENANSLEEIKEESIKTGDEELKKIYFMIGGEEDEESEEL